MFSDEVTDGASIPSEWKEFQRTFQRTKSSQTEPTGMTDNGLQVNLSTISSIQTNTDGEESSKGSPSLMHFLKNAENLMIEELKKNSQSHAFDRYIPNGDEPSPSSPLNLTTSCLHQFRYPVAQNMGLQVTAVSWSCTGSIIACAFGRMDNGNWNNLISFVCLWNLDRNTLSNDQPDQVLETTSAVTTMSCHPDDPALIAGGLYNGDVVLWDIRQLQDPVLAQTGLCPDSHREPVVQVIWIPLDCEEAFAILSASTEGTVLMWRLSINRSELNLTAAYFLSPLQVPHNPNFKIRGTKNMGLTSLAVSPWDKDTFIVGSEGGLILRCSFTSRMLAACETKTLLPKAPAVFTFRPCDGPVYSIQFSPFQRNLFLSCGTEGVVHLHSLLQANPLLSFRVTDSFGFQLQWSPSRPMIFAAATGEDHVQIFDLSCPTTRATTIIEECGAKATCLAFNQKDQNLLAVGKADGSVGIWQLSSELTAKQSWEKQHLEQIATQLGN